MSEELADDKHGWQLTATLLPVIRGLDLQQTMATRGRSSSSHPDGATQQFLQFACLASGKRQHW